MRAANLLNTSNKYIISVKSFANWLFCWLHVGKIILYRREILSCEYWELEALDHMKTASIDGFSDLEIPSDVLKLLSMHVREWEEQWGSRKLLYLLFSLFKTRYLPFFCIIIIQPTICSYSLLIIDEPILVVFLTRISFNSALVIYNFDL